MRQRNHGLRKRCGCPRTGWPKCTHGWHFNFRWKGVSYRLSLDRECGRHIGSKTEAQREAERIRLAIREGRYGDLSRAATLDEMTFSQFATVWEERRGHELANAYDNRQRLKKIFSYPLPGSNPLVTFGQKPLASITTDDVESYRDHRKVQGLSAVTVNHDLRLLRKMFNWGIRKGYLERTPFKIGTEPAIRLEREIPRHRRFEDDDDEQKLLAAANPHLRAVVIAMLDTACRPGEIFNLQVRDVSIARRELTIRAVTEKTRTERVLPISKRLLAVLELRLLDPAGRPLPPDAYVFGNPIGRQVKSVQTAWNNTCAAIGLEGFQLRDLRHEAGSRFDEAGIPINYVSKMLGHTNLTTTSRYLNINRRELHRVMHRYEESAPSLHKVCTKTRQTHKPLCNGQTAPPSVTHRRI